MSLFKDQLEVDVDIFLNIDEFGETRNIDGKDMTVIVDDVHKQPNKEDYDYDNMGREVYVNEKILCVKKSDFGGVPIISHKFRLDGESYVVKHCSEESGILIITIRGGSV